MDLKIKPELVRLLGRMKVDARFLLRELGGHFRFGVTTVLFKLYIFLIIVVMVWYFFDFYDSRNIYVSSGFVGACYYFHNRIFNLTNRRIY